mgnify:CR=1 FL=1
MAHIANILTRARDTLFYDTIGVLILGAFTCALLHLVSVI